MIYNGQAFRGHDAIRAVHVYVGMSSTPGALRGLRNVRDHVHVTDDEIVVEGRKYKAGDPEAGEGAFSAC
jgi:hypothetical protein